MEYIYDSLDIYGFTYSCFHLPRIGCHARWNSCQMDADDVIPEEPRWYSGEANIFRKQMPHWQWSNGFLPCFLWTEAPSPPACPEPRRETKENDENGNQGYGVETTSFQWSGVVRRTWNLPSSQGRLWAWARSNWRVRHDLSFRRLTVF